MGLIATAGFALALGVLGDRDQVARETVEEDGAEEARRITA
jgi:hypothetical protein